MYIPPSPMFDLPVTQGIGMIFLYAVRSLLCCGGVIRFLGDVVVEIEL